MYRNQKDSDTFCKKQEKKKLRAQKRVFSRNILFFFIYFKEIFNCIFKKKKLERTNKKHNFLNFFARWQQ